MRLLLLILVTLFANALYADIVITHARVYTLNSPDVLENTTIVVADNGRIKAIGADIEVPRSAKVVNAAGKVVTPGLIDSYTQLGLVEIEAEASTTDASTGESDSNDGFRMGPSFSVRYAFNPASVVLPINLVEGVTHAVAAPVNSHDIFAGNGAMIQLAGENLSVANELAMFAALGNNGARYTGGSRSAAIIRMREAFTAAKKVTARTQASKGFYSVSELLALKAFMRSNKPLVVKVDRASDIRVVVELADEFDLKLILLGASEAWKVRGLLVEYNVAVVIDPLDNLPVSFGQLGARLDNAALLSSAGVKVAFTTSDIMNSRLLRQVAGNAVANGMPWINALAAITKVPAQIWGMQETLGTLEVGRMANLVVWSGDPLELSTWAEGVMLNGKWMSLESRQTRLYERYRMLNTLKGDQQLPYAYR